MNIPRLVVSALRGGAGKTILSLGLVAALKQRGQAIAPFKKGPDYIDTGWLAMTAGRDCYNLDTFLLEKEQVCTSFARHARHADLAVIEGNRGLYDGIDMEGSTSTAELAKLLGAPVVLCLDATKTTRTTAAIVGGCLQFDPGVAIAGVVLNRVAGSRHESILTRSIQHHCGVPVLGAIPKLRRQIFPERHMGLIPTPEHQWARESVRAVGELAEKYLNLDSLTDIARKNTANRLPGCGERAFYPEPDKAALNAAASKPRIGIMRDSAFQFYYPENLEALQHQGAELIFLSPLRDGGLPAVDGLYLGGGFPETHAAELAGNAGFREDVRRAAEDGLPIYAECGGLMYLGETLAMGDQSYPMTGILPVDYGFSRRPRGHGYTVVEVVAPNPYFEIGSRIRGHEFHYSYVTQWRGQRDQLAFKMARGTGFTQNLDGVTYKNVLGTYTHLHALGTPQWAPALVRAARSYSSKKA